MDEITAVLDVRHRTSADGTLYLRF